MLVMYQVEKMKGIYNECLDFSKFITSLKIDHQDSTKTI